MAELHEPLKRDLAALRERASPSTDVEARVLAAVEAIGVGPDFEPDSASDKGAGFEPAANDGGATGHAAQLLWAGKIVAATLALTTAGLLTVAAAGRAIRDRPDVTHEAATESTPVATPAAIDAPPQTPATDPAPPPAVEVPAAQPRPSRPRSPVIAPATPSDADPLAAELALIEAARAAGDARAAVVHLREHARRFEHGALATERELLLIERLCEQGSLGEARARLARAFANASPQRSKLLERCPALAR